MFSLWEAVSMVTKSQNLESVYPRFEFQFCHLLTLCLWKVNQSSQLLLTCDRINNIYFPICSVMIKMK